MLSLASFVCWRDATLLFQSVPCIALFGLVGTYDTFKASPYLFFGFLLALATLMARAHGRLMMRQAVASGRSDVSRLSEGPWRWMAGPSWALASAAAVVVLSVLGAPALQEGAKALGITGVVKGPTIPQKTPTFSPAAFGNGISTRVGNGPNNLSNAPILSIRMEEFSYLRTGAFYRLRGHEWLPANTTNADLDLLQNIGLQEIEHPKRSNYEVHPVVRLADPPKPIESDRVTNRMASKGDGIEGYIGSYFRESSNAPQQTDRNAALEPALMDSSDIPEAVKAFAKKVTAGAKSDYDAAMMLKTAIGQRCLYNLSAPPTPEQADPGEDFLFRSKQGYCDLFATSMVECARSIGLPARYATGYLPDQGDSSGEYTVKESDAHAWAEILFKNVGWVVFDATESAQAVPGQGRGGATAHPEQAKIWLNALLGVALGVAAIFALVQFRKLRLETKAAWTPRKELAKVYGRFERAIVSKTGRPRRLNQTTGEFVAGSLGPLREAGAQAQRLSQQFDSALYGAGELSLDDLAKLEAETKALAGALRDLPKR